jgi:hypothetical protein
VTDGYNDGTLIGSGVTVEVWMTRSLFGPHDDGGEKPAEAAETTMSVLITVKAAPNPSSSYGETVCVAGLRIDPGSEDWVRLYPISFRDLEGSERFKKYQVVYLRAMPNPRDRRIESWRPNRESIAVGVFLPPWGKRRAYIDPYIEDSMCIVHRAVIGSPQIPGRSLAAVRPKTVRDLLIKPHPGWSNTEQAKVDKYVDQPDLTGRRRTALEAPRFQGWYSYLCWEPCCRVIGRASSTGNSSPSSGIFAT